MSVAFSAYNGMTLAATLGNIDTAFGWGAPNNVGLNTNAGIVIPYAGMGAGNLAVDLPAIQGRWNCDRSEENRRVYIDAFIRYILENFAGIPGTLIVTCEENIPAAGGAGVAFGGQIGHGKPDYLFSQLLIPAGPPGGNPTPRWNPSIVLEAKLDINSNGNHDYGENQLIAQMATARQMSIAQVIAPNQYQRGILTDGRYWRFYEFDFNGRSFVRTNAYDTLGAPIGGVAQNLLVLRLLRKFIANYNHIGGSIWL